MVLLRLMLISMAVALHSLVGGIAERVEVEVAVPIDNGTSNITVPVTVASGESLAEVARRLAVEYQLPVSSSHCPSAARADPDTVGIKILTVGCCLMCCSNAPRDACRGFGCGERTMC